MSSPRPGPVPPDGQDPHEFALQLAVVLERLDERSIRAVSRVEAACAALKRDSAAAARGLAAERGRIAGNLYAADRSRLRLLWIASVALLAGALVALAGASLAVASAKRELDSIHHDQMLLDAINGADITLCGDRLCARLLDAEAAEAAPGYRRIAPR